MQKYKTITDFPSSSGVMALLGAVVTAIPHLFSIIIFIIWIFGTASSYYSILVTVGKKRFWHCLTAMSFICFLLALIIAGMNTATITFLNGYWIGFYILFILGSWLMLSSYK